MKTIYIWRTIKNQNYLGLIVSQMHLICEKNKVHWGDNE